MVLKVGHPRLKQLRKLTTDRTARRDDGQFVVEGPVLVAEALRSDLTVHEVFAETAALDPVLRSFVEGLGVTITEVAPGGLSKVLSTVTPRPVAAVASLPSFASWHDLKAGPVLALVNVSDPGNLGTILRTAEAAGCAGVALLGQSVDPTNPKVVRASAGAVLRVPLVRVEDPEPPADLASTDRTLVGTVIGDRGSSYDSVDLTNAVIFLGSEAHGLPPAYSEPPVVPVTIELAGPTESLNVAAAAAVFAFESLRQLKLTGQNTSPRRSSTS